MSHSLLLSGSQGLASRTAASVSAPQPCPRAPARQLCSRAAPAADLTRLVQQLTNNRGHAHVVHAVRADQQADQLDAATMKLIADITQSTDSLVTAKVAEHAQAASELSSEPTSELRKKLEQSMAKVEKGLLERETEVRLLLLAALAGEHLLLLGPPGTAKSELSRRLSGLCGGKYYERLLTRFSVPEELFGPLSMSGLENDQYVRQTEGYLPTAEIAFVDEIFKANSAILNALLTLLNERLFDNGNQRLHAPLMCLVGASNELPESEELDALYDRFLIRRSVSQVSNAQVHKLARLAAGRPVDTIRTVQTNGNGNGTTSHPLLTIADFRSTAVSAHASVDVPDSVIELLVTVRNWLQDKCEPPVYVSDRRFMKVVQMLQVAAFTDGREEVHEYDCLLLEYVFGSRPDDSAKVRQSVLDTLASDPGLQSSELLFLGLFGRACRLLAGGPSAEVSECAAEADTLAQLLEERHRNISITLEGQFPELRSTLWQSEASVQATVQALLPQMTENKKKVEDLLRETYVLRACLQGAHAAGVLERLLPRRYKQYQKGISSKV